MYKPLLCIVAMLYSVLSYAQPTIAWKKAYGGTLAESVVTAGTSARFDIQQTADGGYVFVSTSFSSDGDVSGTNHGGGDVWVVKTNSTGAITWQKLYGGTGNDVGASVMQTADKGYIIGAYTNTSNNGDVTGNHGQADLWLLKLDSTGALQWQKALGGSSFDEFTQGVLQSADGGYVITGITYSSDGDIVGGHGSAIDIWVVKVTSTGTVSWSKCLGGTGLESVGTVEETKDHGFIVSGSSGLATGDVTSNYGSSDGWLVKLTPAGTIQWQKSYGGSKIDHLASARQCADGNYIATGFTASQDNDLAGSPADSQDVWVLKTDSMGVVIWSKSFGGSNIENGISVSQSGDANYIVAGFAGSANGDVSGLHGTQPDCWLLGLYPDGTLRWTSTLGGNTSDRATQLLQTTDGGYISVGYLSDSTGDGAACGYHGSGDVWVIKFNSILGVEELNAASAGIKVYPNPTNGRLFVSLPEGLQDANIQMLDMKGCNVQISVSTNGNERVIEAGNIPAATYLLLISSKDGRMSSYRVVVER